MSETPRPEVYPGPHCPNCNHSFWFDYDGRTFCSFCGEEGVHVNHRRQALSIKVRVSERVLDKVRRRLGKSA